MKIALMIFATMILSACATTSAFEPRPSFSIERDIKDLHEHFQDSSSITNYYSGEDNSQRRNEFIAGRLTLYNLEYIQFIRNFRLSRAQEQGAFDITQLGLGLATTLAAGEHTKTVLGAVTTALTGARSSYEKTFFDNQTTGALITQMNADRKVALIPILAGAKATIAEYPLTQSIADLTEYQVAGTIDGALQAVQRDAGVKDAKASALIDQYRTVSFKPDDMTARVKAWLFPGGTSFDTAGIAHDDSGAVVAIKAENLAALKSEIKALKLDGLTLEAFLISGDLAAARAKAVTDLKIP